MFFCRLLSRIIFIPFGNIKREMNEEQSALWQQVFNNLLSKVSAVVDLIAVGEWLTSNEGHQQFNDCLAIVVEGFGEEGKGTRFAKMWWTCALMAALKVIRSRMGPTNHYPFLLFFVRKVFILSYPLHWQMVPISLFNTLSHNWFITLYSFQLL